MLKAKDNAVDGLTKGIELLFKKNKVDYLKGTASFVSPTRVAVQLNDGGATEVEARNVIIATGSEVTPFPGGAIAIDEKQIVSSTGALALPEVPEKMVVIGGGIIGLEMASVWSRLGTKVTVVEFLNQIGGPGMDTEIAKSAQKLLKKQGINFKLGTKVFSGDTSGSQVKLDVDSAKGGKASQVRSFKDSSLATGVFFLDVLNGMKSAYVDYDLVASGRTDEEAYQNAKLAISIARKMGATIWLVPEDITSLRSRLIVTFIGSLMATSEKMGV